MCRIRPRLGFGTWVALAERSCRDSSVCICGVKFWHVDSAVSDALVYGHVDYLEEGWTLELTLAHGLEGIEYMDGGVEH